MWLLADPIRAGKMQSYLKTKQAFYGVKAAERRNLVHKTLAEYNLNKEDLLKCAWELWLSNNREDRHAAIDIILKNKKSLIKEANFETFTHYFKNADNWDLLDALAINILGIIFLNNRQFSKEITMWIYNDNMWIRRASLLVHLKHKDKTDLELLSFTITELIAEKEFFIRKAIGWVLRTYSQYDPKWVKHFVNENPDLSNLSKNEALRKIKK